MGCDNCMSGYNFIANKTMVGKSEIVPTFTYLDVENAWNECRDIYRDSCYTRDGVHYGWFTNLLKAKKIIAAVLSANQTRYWRPTGESWWPNTTPPTSIPNTTKL